MNHHVFRSGVQAATLLEGEQSIHSQTLPSEVKAEGTGEVGSHAGNLLVGFHHGQTVFANHLVAIGVALVTGTHEGADLLALDGIDGTVTGGGEVDAAQGITVYVDTHSLVMVEFKNLVPVLGQVEGGAEGNVAGADEVSVELELNTLVLDVTGIDPLVLDTGGVRKGDLHHLVHGIGVIVGEVDTQTVLEEVPLGTHFPGSHHFGLQVGIGNGGGIGNESYTVLSGGAQQGFQLIRIGILTHLGPGSAELTVVQNVLVVVHTQLIQHAGEEVRQAHGRIEVAAVGLREGGGPVVTGGHIQEEEVLPTQVGESVDGVDLLLVDIIVGITVKLTGTDIIGTGERNVLGNGAERFALVVHDVATHAGTEVKVSPLVVVGEEAFQVVFHSGALLHAELRPVEAGGVIQTLALVRDTGPGETFLHLEAQVLAEVDGDGAHTEELVLNVTVVEVVLDEVRVLAVRANLVPVDLGFSTGSGGGSGLIEPMLGEVGNTDAAGHGEEAVGRAVGATGLTVGTGGVHVVGFQIQFEPVRDLVAGNEVNAGTLDVGGAHHGVGVVVADGETERVVLVASGDGHVVALAAAGAIELRPRIGSTLIRNLGGAVPPVGHHGGGAHGRTPGAGSLSIELTQGTLAVDVLHAGEVGDRRPGELAAVADAKLLVALAALLGGDEDDTVTGAGTVQSGSGGAFQHGNALDVLGVDVERTALVVLGAPQTGRILTGSTAVVIRDTIHHVQRGVVVGEGGVTTQNHTGGTTGTGGGIVDGQTGHLAHQGVGEGNATTTGEFFRFHVLNGITQGFLLTGDTEGGNNNLVQEFAVFAEGHFNGLAVKDNLYSLVADAAHHEGGANGHVGKCKGTVNVGDGTVVGSGYNYASTDNGADVVIDNTRCRTVLSRSYQGHAGHGSHQ